LLGWAGLFLVIEGLQIAKLLLQRLFDLEERAQLIGVSETLENQLE